MTPSHQEIIDVLRPFARRANYFDKLTFPLGDEQRYADDEPSGIYLAELRAARNLLSRLDAEGEAAAPPASGDVSGRATGGAVDLLRQAYRERGRLRREIAA